MPETGWQAGMTVLVAAAGLVLAAPRPAYAVGGAITATGVPAYNSVTGSYRFEQHPSDTYGHTLQTNCRGTSTLTDRWVNVAASNAPSFAGFYLDTVSGGVTGTLTCNAGETHVGWRMVYSDGPLNGQVAASGEIGAPPPVCAPGESISDYRASYVSGELRVTFKWTGGTPTGGFAAYAPDPGSTLPPSPSIYVTAPVAGAPGYFYGAGVVSAFAGNVRLVLVSTPACYALARPNTTVPVTPGSSTDVGAEDPDDGESCGLNPFCHTKAALAWAFIPDEDSTDAVKNLGTTLTTKFPFSLAEEVNAWMDQFGECEGDPSGCAHIRWEFVLAGETFTIVDSRNPQLNVVTATIDAHRTVVSGLAWASFAAFLMYSVLFPTIPFWRGGGKH